MASRAVVVPEVLKHVGVLVKANALELLPRQGWALLTQGPLSAQGACPPFGMGSLESPDF